MSNKLHEKQVVRKLFILLKEMVNVSLAVLWPFDRLGRIQIGHIYNKSVGLQAICAIFD